MSALDCLLLSNVCQPCNQLFVLQRCVLNLCNLKYGLVSPSSLREVVTASCPLISAIMRRQSECGVIRDACIAQLVASLLVRNSQQRMVADVLADLSGGHPNDL